MGKKRSIVVISDNDDDGMASGDRSSTRSRSAPSSKSSRGGGSSKKANVGRSKTRSGKKYEDEVRSSEKANVGRSKTRSGKKYEVEAKFDKISEDFGECLRDFNVVPGWKCANMKEIWVDKYKPRSLSELAVQKKKVDEVKRWLEERLLTFEEGFGNSTLLITGPTGVGKSETVRVIASQLGAELCEWTTPTPTLWQEHVHNINLGTHYMSKLDEFQTFVEKVGKYGLLHPSCNGETRKPVIVLIDDLPMTNGRIAVARLNKCLTTLVHSSQVPTVILITEYHKTESIDSLPNSLEALQSTLEKSGAYKVAFNPITVNSIKKTLSWICVKEKCDVTADWIDTIAKASGGDIRHAVTSLQYLCLGPMDAFSLPVLSLPAIQSGTSVETHNSLSSPSVACSENPYLRPSLSVGFGRDEPLTLFHALGKFLHNKRETADANALGQPSLVLQEKLSRKPIKMDAPENVLSQAHGQARTIADFLYENALDFISDEAIDDAWLVTSYLCDADFLLGSSLRPTRYRMMSEVYESENLVQSAAASVAARGVLFGNSHPSPSRWHTIRSPGLWQIQQLSWHNKNRMAAERFEDLTGRSLYSSCETAEYGPTIKWLKSKTSYVDHTPHENFSFNNKSEDDHPAWMIQKNDDISTQIIEEDEIEDW